jgi:hypothetical protein
MTSRAELRVKLRDSMTDFVQDIEIRLPENRCRLSRRVSSTYGAVAIYALDVRRERLSPPESSELYQEALLVTADCRLGVAIMAIAIEKIAVNLRTFVWRPRRTSWDFTSKNRPG